MKKLLLAAIIVAGIYSESDLNKQVLLQECIDYKGGSDQDCEECYREIYGDEAFELMQRETNEQTKNTIEI